MSAMRAIHWPNQPELQRCVLTVAKRHGVRYIGRHIVVESRNG